MRLLIASLMISLVGAGASRAAEAITYSGTIGSLPIIVELTSPGGDGLRVGRYAYLSKGADIPLHGVKVSGNGALRLDEEKPCSEKLCKTASGDVIDAAPIAAEWSLTADAGGNHLVGTWRDKESGKTFPIKLTQNGKRQLSDTNTDLLDGLDPSYAGSDAGNPYVLSKDDLPYDFLKMDHPLKQGAVSDLDGSIYRMDKDSRTGLDYPFVVKIGKVDPARLNRYLAQQRLQFSLSAFSCMMKAYLGFGWSGQDGEGTTGYDGGGSATVEYLTPRLMGISEGGSYYCGGAHPDNFGDHRLADAKTGKALLPESLLRGWVATNADGTVVDAATAGDPSQLTFGPSEDLINYVISHRDKFDDETEKDCGFEDLIRTNLAVYFTENNLVFTLQGLPHVIFACTDDLFQVPLKDARPLLTNTAAGYFEALDR